MDQLSRNVHLWVEYFNRTQDALRPPLELGQVGTVEFERVICQTDTLERIWSDESVLQTIPRFWRDPPYTSETGLGNPVGIMGEYMILERYQLNENQYTYSWVSMQDQNGQVIFVYDISPARLATPVRSSMDPSTNTFHVVFTKGVESL